MQESITNLSMGLMEHALDILQRQAFPVYMKNITQRIPPIAYGEFTPSAIAMLLLTSGIDYHLARLKYLRDIVSHKPPLPYPKYFNWDIDFPLSQKIERLLIKPREKRLKESLLELTAVRDSVAHPKLYLVREVIKADMSFGKSMASLPLGSSLRSKALQRKMKRSELTKLLRLPLVPTWISYTDVVIGVLVVNQFLNLLEEKYGNPYAWVGGVSVRNEPLGFFKGKEEGSRRLRISMGEWAQAFFDSLSTDDQQRVKKRLGDHFSRHIHKKTREFRIKMGKNGEIELLDPPEPEFLRKPPPWPI